MAGSATARARHGSRVPAATVMRVVAAAIAGVLGFGMVFGTTYWVNLQHSLTTQDISGLVRPPSTDPNATDGPTRAASPTDSESGRAINILLIGSDTRSGENGDIGGRKAGGMRSDTTLIMHISADRSRIDFLSIPRDSRVRISDCTMFDGSVKKGWTAKFNAAFSLGGSDGNTAEAAACTMQTIQDLTGITFDHYAVVDFVGFEKMINAVGGVPMCITERTKSKKAQLDLQPGAQVLDGKTALAYARARYGIGDGSDLGRIDRQHELMDNLAKKVLGMNVLTDAPELTQLLKAAGQSMTMDPDLGSFTYLVGLAYSLRNINQDHITFATVPWKYPGDKSGDVVWTAEASTVFKRIINDIPLDGGTTQEVEPSSSPTHATSAPHTSTPATTQTPGTTQTPSTSPTPERLTQDEILAQCQVG